MNIELVSSDANDFCSAIREKIECGQCSASTLLLWEKTGIGESPRGASRVTVIDKENNSEKAIYFLVRCSFFKFNVSDPEDIIHCEGYKQKKS